MSDRPNPGPKVRKGLIVFYVLCAGLVVLDLSLIHI